MRFIAITFLLLACNGCVLVGCDRAMPGFAFYWSAEAKRCRQERAYEKQQEKQYQAQQQLGKELAKQWGKESAVGK